jgi:hypothetical protein
VGKIEFLRLKKGVIINTDTLKKVEVPYLPTCPKQGLSAYEDGTDRVFRNVGI